MNRPASYKKGLLFAVAAYFIWGIFPLYWKLLDQIPATQILAHRIVWSFVFLAIIIMFSRDQSFRQYIKSKKIWWVLSMSAIVIACNWGIYIYAVNNEQIVEASLGYYINPIVNIALGIICLYLPGRSLPFPCSYLVLPPLKFRYPLWVSSSIFHLPFSC